MVWFFGILILLVLGVIAVVASGEGGSMAEVYDDRPDARIPADGPLTAEDLLHARFSTAFRGYRMAEVDALLDRLSAELAAAARPSQTQVAGGEAPPPPGRVGSSAAQDPAESEPT